MATLTGADIEVRIARLAKRLGFTGPDSTERVLDMALEYLDDGTVEPRPLYTRERRDASEQEGAAHMAKHGYLDENSNRPTGIPP